MKPRLRNAHAAEEGRLARLEWGERSPHWLASTVVLVAAWTVGCGAPAGASSHDAAAGATADGASDLSDAGFSFAITHGSSCDAEAIATCLASSPQITLTLGGVTTVFDRECFDEAGCPTGPRFGTLYVPPTAEDFVVPSFGHLCSADGRSVEVADTQYWIALQLCPADSGLCRDYAVDYRGDGGTITSDSGSQWHAAGSLYPGGTEINFLDASGDAVAGEIWVRPCAK